MFVVSIESGDNSEGGADTIGDQCIQRRFKLVVLDDGGLQIVFRDKRDSAVFRSPKPPAGGCGEEVVEREISDVRPDLRPAGIPRKIGDGCIRQSFDQRWVRHAAAQQTVEYRMKRSRRVGRSPPALAVDGESLAPDRLRLDRREIDLGQ